MSQESPDTGSSPMDAISRFLPRVLWPRPAPGSQGTHSLRPLPYSWVLNQQLAIGPMPRSGDHWQQLEAAGFLARFSCCYPEEEVFEAPPSHWLSGGYALPDHRNQEPLRTETLRSALEAGVELLGRAESPLYLHCFAGRERSSLMAVGLTARLRNVDLFAALDAVRLCHPPAAPILEHLELLERVLRT